VTGVKHRAGGFAGCLLLAQMRSADRIGQGPLSGSNRKTFARIEFFSVWPAADFPQRKDDPSRGAGPLHWTSTEARSLCPSSGGSAGRQMQAV